MKSLKSTLLTIAIAIGSACVTAHAVPTYATQPAAETTNATHDSRNTIDILAQRRATHIARLAAYVEAGVFPQNRLSDRPLNVFIDDAGHLCAAANLMAKDGYIGLVQRTARDDNFLVLSTVTAGPLMDWMLTSGFTQDEIARIQEPYMPVSDNPLRGPSDPIEPIFALSADQERERLQGVLRGVVQSLQANTQKSLILAGDALAARPDLVSALHTPSSPEAPQRFAKAP